VTVKFLSNAPHVSPLPIRFVLDGPVEKSTSCAVGARVSQSRCVVVVVVPVVFEIVIRFPSGS